jgi:hypothetical protein
MTERSKIYRDADGVRKTLIWDDETPDRVTVRTEQDLAEILDGIARDREIAAGQRAKDIQPSHRLPIIVYEDLKKRGIADDPDTFRKWLNSSEATPWRIYHGTV